MFFLQPWKTPLQDVERDARSARREADQNSESLRELGERVDQLSLFCMALWSLLQEKTNVTEDDLADRIERLDVENSKETATRTCGSCGRVLSRRHLHCLYCGK